MYYTGSLRANIIENILCTYKLYSLNILNHDGNTHKTGLKNSISNYIL